MTAELAALCIALEHFETPEWSVHAILKEEPMPLEVLDPCVGAGVMARAARDFGYKVQALDIHDWGFPGTHVRDFLLTTPAENAPPFAVFMNPPFSKACEFVEHAFALGAEMVICFQRFAWWESVDRRAFWDKYPPSKVWICGNRADCWRHDLALLAPKDRINPKTGKRMASGTTTAHAFFVFRRGHAGATALGRLYRL